MKPETKRKKRIAKNQLYLFEIQESMSEQDYIDFWNNVQKNILDNLKKIEQADQNKIQKYQNLSRKELESLILQGKIQLTVWNPYYDEYRKTYRQTALISVVETLD